MVPRARLIRDHDDECEVHRALTQRTIQVSFCGFLWLFLLSLTPAAAFATDPHDPPTVASLKSESRSATLPFFVGEELSFEVRWMGILAGNARMAVSGQVSRDGHDVYHIRSLAESSPFFSLFYYVRDSGETFVDVRELLPWYYHLDQREGSRAVQRTVTFDQRRGVAIHTKDQEAPQEVKVPLGVHDSLSSFYILRTLPLRVGQSIHLHTFANGKTYEVGPGDFMGFTAPGAAHHMINPYAEDLVYLMGGERSGLDVGHFPRLGRKIVFGATGGTGRALLEQGEAAGHEMTAFARKPLVARRGRPANAAAPALAGATAPNGSAASEPRVILGDVPE